MPNTVQDQYEQLERMGLSLDRVQEELRSKNGNNVLSNALDEMRALVVEVKRKYEELRQQGPEQNPQNQNRMQNLGRVMGMLTTMGLNLMDGMRGSNLNMANLGQVQQFMANFVNTFRNMMQPANLQTTNPNASNSSQQAPPNTTNPTNPRVTQTAANPSGGMAGLMQNAQAIMQQIVNVVQSAVYQSPTPLATRPSPFGSKR